MKPPPVSADLSTDVGSSNPRVVVGVPPSDPPPPSAPESAAPPSVEAKGTVDGVIPSAVPAGVDPLEALETLEQSSLPPPAKTSETEEQDEPTQTAVSLGSTIAFGSTSDGEPAGALGEKRDESDKTAEKTKAFTSTLAFGSTVAADEQPEKTEVAAATEPMQPVKVAEAPLPTPKAVVEQVEQVEPAAKALVASTTTGKKNKKNKAAKAERAQAAAAETTDPDEVSVPPIGDIAVDEQFFSEGDVSRHLEGDAIEGDDALTIPDKAKRKAEPHVVERRARFVRYVKWAVAGAAVVCLAAVARTTMSSSKAPPTSAVRAAAVVTTPVTEAAPAAPKAAQQAAAPIATPADPPAAPAAGEPVAANAASPAAEPATTAAPADDSKRETATETAPETKPEESSGDAKEEKTKARTLLEKRKLADAIDAGERAVKLDPTDGEAWLILGAAYQEKGNMVEARRAYGSCVKEGKTGPHRQECAKMLR